jgi:hypothetical protein
MIDELEKYMTKHQTDQHVSAAFLLGIESWLNGKPAPNPKKHFPTASPELWQAFQEQTKIGWRHLLKGRLTSKWSIFINHQHHNNEPIQETGTKSKPYVNHAAKWGQHVISIIWDHVLKIWNARNKTEHGEDIQEETSRKKEKMIIEAKAIIKDMENSSYQDQEVTDMNVQTIHELSVAAIKTWIRNTKILLKINKAENQLHKTQPQLPFDRGPLREISTPHQQNKQNRVSRRSVQETLSTSRGV